MEKKMKIETQKRTIKKVIKSSSQGIEKRVIAKRERGITLIALVVTIIIMLILAAVTLNMALGDNGLIQMAKLAANKYEQAAINESLAMKGLADSLNNPGSVAPSTTTTPTPTPSKTEPTPSPSPSTGGTGEYSDQYIALNDTWTDVSFVDMSTLHSDAPWPDGSCYVVIFKPNTRWGFGVYMRI